jgi:hypothetical protein
MAVLSTSACTDLLKETPRATYTPGFFSTVIGVENGISGLYEALRDPYGDYIYAFQQVGTDESTYADLADGNFINPDLTAESGYTIIRPDNDPASRFWNNKTFSTINNASGIIKNGTEAGIDPSLLAEANFFRAYRYFLLATTFGGAPLDLGSGELEFNETPNTASVRNTVAEVYTKAIFPDLLHCIEYLPDTPRRTGAVTKNVARFFLAKAYLTYAWWLENPNNIPTWPEVPTPRTDPDGLSAQQYFQLAYDTALYVINNPGPYGLEPTFYEAHLPANDRGPEMMFYVDHLENTQYGGFNSGNNGSNFYHFFFTTPQFDQIYTGNGNQTNYVAIRREAAQSYGRPWARMVPTIEALTETFADKTNDSRFQSTFVTTYFANWHKAGGADAAVQSVTNLHNNLTIPQRGAVLKFIEEQPEGTVIYPTTSERTGEGANNWSAGYMTGEAAYVLEISKINRRAFPQIWKTGQARANNGDGLGDFNGESPRPQKLAMFSELYFIAAEAAVMGASGTQSARDLINVIRARAGKWFHDNSKSLYEGVGNSVGIDKSAEMVAATPATIDIDYILMERSREYYGDGYRWYDLTRTQRWQEYGATYSMAEKGGHNVRLRTRDISTHLYLRPIPQGQIDAMDEGLRQAYQNPGY